MAIMSEKSVQTIDDSKPLEVMVSPTDRVVSEKEAVEGMRRLGLEKVRESTVRDLEALGIHMKTVGTLKIQRGWIMVDQNRLHIAMCQIANLLTKIATEEDPKKNKKQVEHIGKLAASLSELSRRSTDAGRLAVEIEGLVSPGGSPSEEPESEQQGFVVGQPVRARPGNNIVARDVHIHTSGD